LDYKKIDDENSTLKEMKRLDLRPVLNVQGRILIILSGFMLTMVPWVFYFDETEYLPSVALSISIVLVTGLLSYFFTRGKEIKFGTRESYLLVSLSWIVMGLAGSLPFLLSRTIPRFPDAIFESVSGFTTTGSSILTDIESLPKSILYWRSLSHWIGGMGIIVLVIAILPAMKIPGYRLFSLESSGISAEKIKPRTKDMAVRLWLIYIALTFVLILLLMAGKMNFYESLCHAFGTVATGGFSTKNTSITNYSAYIQYMIMLFMLLSGINFSLYYFLIQGRLRNITTNTEVKVFVSIVLLTGITISAIVFFTSDTGLEKIIRDAFFQVISIITATGFATFDYLEWHQSAWLIILGLMFVGACVGSTGGGIKVIRHIVAYKLLVQVFRKINHTHSVQVIKVNNNPIDEKIVGSVMVFILTYIFIVISGSFVLMLTGLDFPSSLGGLLATLGGIGPGLGSVGPAGNFTHLTDFAKLFLTFIMIAGRLEIFTILLLFTPSFWK
jgi:trk system potassium uptake protein